MRIESGTVQSLVCATMIFITAPAGDQNAVVPTNDLPNPYTSAAWGQLPDRQWGALSAITQR